MDIKDSRLPSNFKCIQHNKDITCIYLKQDANLKLACVSCLVKNKLDNNYVVEISELLGFNDGFILNNFPPGINEQLLEQLNKSNIQSINKEELKEQISKEFQNFSEHITAAINKHKKEVLRHIDNMDNERLNCNQIYDEISSKTEIINEILNNQTNPEKLNAYLTNLIQKKQASQEQDSQKIKDALNRHSQLIKQFDMENMKEKLSSIVETIKQTNLLKEIEQQQKQQYQQQQLPLEIIQQQQQSNIINQQIMYNPQQPMITQQIKIDSLSKLSSITNLPQHQDIYIDLNKQQLSQEQVKQLRDALQPCTQVIQIILDLQFSKIGDSGLKMILQSLDQMKHLRQFRLYLQDTNIQQEGVQCLAKTLQSYTYLTHLELDLNDNQNVRDEDVTDLIDIIKCKSTLTYLYLDLDSTNTGDRTVRQLADELKYNLSNLSIFYFSFQYNYIGDDTVIYLTQAIQSIQSKLNEVKLWLQGNLIGDRGVQSMINALSNCQNLQTLKLYVFNNKNIGQNGKKALAEFNNKIKSILKKINDYGFNY